MHNTQLVYARCSLTNHTHKCVGALGSTRPDLFVRTSSFQLSTNKHTYCMTYSYSIYQYSTWQGNVPEGIGPPL